MIDGKFARQFRLSNLLKVIIKIQILVNAINLHIFSVSSVGYAGFQYIR